VLDDAECAAELGRGLGLAGGEWRGEDAVVDFGVEDGEGQAVGDGARSRTLIKGLGPDRRLVV
jgi:hypothetical protein